ncbi:MAG: helix-turn-helix domain-containing protein [Rhodospirillales bacterium]
MNSMKSGLNDDLLRGAEAIGGYLGESRRRVHYMCQQGHIPAFQVGKRWYAKKSDLDKRFSAAG